MQCPICRGTCLLPTAHAERLTCARCGHPWTDHDRFGCWGRPHATAELPCDCTAQPETA